MHVTQNMVEAIPFRHDSRINDFLYKYMNGAVNLFPNDVLKGKVDQIKGDDFVFSIAAKNRVKDRYYPNVNNTQLKEYAVQRNIKFSAQPTVTFTAEDMQDYRDSMALFEKNICENTYVQPVYRQNDGSAIYPM